MSYSTQRAVSDGTLKTLLLSIDFLDSSYIKVYVDDVELAYGSAWTWATPKTIEFTSPVPAGAAVAVRRSTNIAAIRHSLSGGAQFTNSTMDANFLQMLHIAQESAEGVALGDLYNPLNMHGFPIRNVGPGLGDNDAIPRSTYLADRAVMVDAAGVCTTQASHAAQAAAQAGAAAAAAAASAILAAGAISGVSTVNGRTGAVTLTKADLGLGDVANTTDEAKPISTPQAAGLVGKDAGAATMPFGDTASRGAAAVGKLRLNTELGTWEGCKNGTDWEGLGGGGGGSSAVEVFAISAGVLNLSTAKAETILVTLDQNITSIILPPGKIGERKDLVLQFTQDAVGGRTVTGWPAAPTCRFSVGGTPAVGSIASSVTQFAASNMANTGWLVYTSAESATATPAMRVGILNGMAINCVNNTPLTTVAVATNRCVFQPYIPSRRQVLQGVRLAVTTLMAASSVAVGIYANAVIGGLDTPGALLASGGVTSTSAVGVVQSNLTYVLEPGVLYWIGVASLAGATVRGVAPAAQGAMLGVVMASGLCISHYGKASTGSTLPADGAGALAVTAVNNPALFLSEVV